YVQSEIDLFLSTAVKIKKNPDNVKFKVRCSRFLYTLVITDKEKAEKLKQSLPPVISNQKNNLGKYCVISQQTHIIGSTLPSSKRTQIAGHGKTKEMNILLSKELNLDATTLVIGIQSYRFCNTCHDELSIPSKSLFVSCLHPPSTEVVKSDLPDKRSHYKEQYYDADTHERVDRQPLVRFLWRRHRFSRHGQ
ncbi:unnamed protein product, partial [Timema podura]|nr:unnamed protein product [Timema podura]